MNTLRSRLITEGVQRSPNRFFRFFPNGAKQMLLIETASISPWRADPRSLYHLRSLPSRH